MKGSQASFVLLLVGILLSGCFGPGAGGTYHLAPEKIVSGQPTQLKLEFVAWGAGSSGRRLDDRYTEVVCLYHLNDSNDIYRLSGRVISVDQKRMEMQFTIPPLDLQKGDTVNYRFEMLFDGHKNTREGGALRVK